MKSSDIPVLIGFLILILFFLYPPTREIYGGVYASHPLITTFIKFALLATAGELVSLRLTSGIYLKRGFGLMPKMIVWGILGLAIYFAFTIFSRGTAALIPGPAQSLRLYHRILTAFLTSLSLNIIFAPVMMLIHHLTDAHIASAGGKFRFSGLKMEPLLRNIAWDRLWGFTLKKTIPLFWIPAHTITFLLPVEYRTLFAALLSVALGLFLGLSMGRKPKIVRRPAGCITINKV